MSQLSQDLLHELIVTPSPTGSEQKLQRLVFDRFKDIAHTLEPDVHGNLILALNPQAKRKIMLAGHCDQIGFLVKYISPDGYLYLDELGGTDAGVILGSQLVIHTQSGPLTGVVGRKTLSFQQGNEVQQIPVKNKIWVDIGAKDEEEARGLVAIGDYVTFPLEVTNLCNDFIAAPGLDNKAGVFVCLEVLRRCAEAGCEVGVYVVTTVQEEIGSRGAATAANKLSPEVGIAVDVIPATDDPGYDMPPQKAVQFSLGAGPTVSAGPNTNPMVGKLLVEAARRREVPFQADPSGNTNPNDSRVLQIADSGVAVASVGIPQRNMHTQVEIVSLKDLEYTVQLLTEFILSVNDETDFRPFYFD